MRPNSTVLDLSWISGSARGLVNSALANLDGLARARPGADVVVLARSGHPFHAPPGATLVELGKSGLAFTLRRERYVFGAWLRSLLRGGRLTYVSWVPRLPVAGLLVRDSEVFVHDLNIFRAKVFVPPFHRPSLASRLHQYLSIRIARRVRCFSRSVLRQLRLVSVAGVLSEQHVSIPRTPPAERRVSPRLRAAMFVDSRSYKGTWCAPRLHSSSSKFELVLVGAPQPSVERTLRENGFVLKSMTCTNEERWSLLRECDFLLFPSRFEGFGIPPREAALVGVPSVILRKAALLDIPRRLSIALDGRGVVDLDAIAREAARIPPDELLAWARNFVPAGALQVVHKGTPTHVQVQGPAVQL